LCEECDYSKAYTRASVPYTCDACVSGSKLVMIVVISLIFSVVVVLAVVYGNISFRDEELRNLFA
jgi:hypothetical protein